MNTYFTKCLLSCLLLTSVGCLSNEQINTQKKNIKPPNIIVIMADDLGFSDIKPYGGEISTPSLQQLANDGIKFSRFYTSLTCSPSRAMLLSGADNHTVGLGNMAETIADNQIGLPGYETHLNSSATTLPEELKKRGYSTFMAGKWHLGLEKAYSPAARGFDQTFALLFGGGSHYQNGFGIDIYRKKSLYRKNGQLVEKLPEGFFSSNFYTNRIIENIKADQNSDKPFFAYLAFTAPHWPLQFPPDYNGKYKDTYAKGWQSIRGKRITRLKKLGLLANDIDNADLSSNLPDWQSLTESERKLAAKDMEIYAAMVDNMDVNIGRLTDFLKEIGEYENTAILFLSDNGADSWGAKKIPKEIEEFADTFDNSLENRGKMNSFVLYGQHWARVSSTPFRAFKGNTTDGGMRVPAVLKLPNKQVGLYQQSVGIEQIKSLMLQLSEQPDIKLKEALSGKQKVNYLGRELWGKVGVINENGKLIKLPPPIGTGQWQLFNTDNDPSELHDLSNSKPKKMKEMLMLWQEYIDDTKLVLPTGKFKIRAGAELPKE